MHSGQLIQHRLRPGTHFITLSQVGSHQRIGHQRHHVGILGLTLELANVIQALLRGGFIGKTGVHQAPHNVGRDRQAVVAQR